MSTEATPTAPIDGTPPVAPVATPSNEHQNDKIVLGKEEHTELVRNAARAGEAQSRADRYEVILKKNGLIGGGHFKSAAPVTPPTTEERQAAGAEEDRKAEKGLLGLALDPAYRTVLDADPTLRDLLTKNPLAVLPVFAPDALDADDAVGLVREMLKKRVAPAPNPIPATPVAPAIPPKGAVNPNDAPINEEVEAARKLPNTERAIAGMIGAKLRANAGKK